MMQEHEILTVIPQGPIYRIGKTYQQQMKKILDNSNSNYTHSLNFKKLYSRNKMLSTETKEIGKDPHHSDLHFFL